MLGRDPFADPEGLIRSVYAYVAYRIGVGPDAEDVTSQTFERALRYRDSYDSRLGSPAAWLIGIARRQLGESASPDVLVDPGDLELRADTDLEEEVLRRLTVAEGLEALDDRDRELLALRYGADLKAREIAELLGTRTNAVEVALHRALARLRRALSTERETAQGRRRP